MLAAREHLVNKVLEIASRKNVKLYGMINDTLELVIRADDMGLSLEEVVDQYGIVKAAKDAGFVPVVESLLYDIVEKVFQRNKRWVTKKWYKSGQWYEKYLLDRFHNQNQVEALGKLLAVTRWDLKEVLVEEEGGVVKVRCVSPLLPLENTELLVRFVEGVMRVFGFVPFFFSNVSLRHSRMFGHLIRLLPLLAFRWLL